MDSKNKLVELASVRPDDHVRGPSSARLVVVEYGDYECPHTRAAETELERLLAENPDVRFVFRHFPLPDLHPDAERLAAIAEAGDPDEFWDRHEILLDGELPEDADENAADDPVITDRIAEDVFPARAAGIHSTPTFLFGAHKYDGSYDYDALVAQLTAARARAGEER